MGRMYARTLFHDAAKRLQERYGSQASYQRLAERGPMDGELGRDEIEFIGARDSFYLATVTEDGWPYMQHRGGPPGFLHVIDPRTLAFADFAGNKQYISTGNLATDDRVSLFLMDYPHRARLKLLGHASVIEAAAQPELTALLQASHYAAKVERAIRIQLVGYDWNCPQHITPRYSAEEIEQAIAAEARLVERR